MHADKSASSARTSNACRSTSPSGGAARSRAMTTQGRKARKECCERIWHRVYADNRAACASLHMPRPTPRVFRFRARSRCPARAQHGACCSRRSNPRRAEVRRRPAVRRFEVESAYPRRAHAPHSMDIRWRYKTLQGIRCALRPGKKNWQGGRWVKETTERDVGSRERLEDGTRKSGSKERSGKEKVEGRSETSMPGKRWEDATDERNLLATAEGVWGDQGGEGGRRKGRNA